MNVKTMRLGIAAAVAVGGGVVWGVTSLTRDEVREGPSRPRQASDTLRMPAPVTQEAEPRGASLPRDLPLGFALEVNGRALVEDWDVVGTVSALDDGRLTIETEDDSEYSLIYRLPGDADLSFSAGQGIRLQRRIRAVLAATGWTVRLEGAAGDLVLAAGRWPAADFITASIARGLDLVQDGRARTVIDRGRYETTYRVPVDVRSGADSSRLQPGQSVQIVFAGRRYTVSILDSHQSVMQPDFEDLREGPGHYLEYLVLWDSAPGVPPSGAAVGPEP